MNPAGSKSSRFAEAFDRAQFWLLMRDYIHRGYMKPLGWIYLLRKGWKKDIFEENRDIVHSELDDIIREYLKVYHDRQLSGEKTVHEEDVDRYVFMDAMVETTEDPLELRCETLNVLMAARDSTASLLTNVFFMLARHPDVWDSLRTEVITTFGDRLPDYGTLRQMKQVRNVLNECECKNAGAHSISTLLKTALRSPPLPSSGLQWETGQGEYDIAERGRDRWPVASARQSWSTSRLSHLGLTPLPQHLWIRFTSVSA